LYEPPRADAALLSSLSKSLTTSTPLSSASSPLDGFYRSHAAIKAWFDAFLSYPVSSYYCVPLPISINMIYATIVLGRWAKLSGLGGRTSADIQPRDPSGSYSNPTHGPPTPASSILNDSPSSADGDQLAPALAALKVQLATQPGLHLDINGLIETLCDRLDEAGAALVARSMTPHAPEGNVWMLKAAKLRVAQFKLQQWAEMVGGEGVEEEEEDDGMVEGGEQGSQVSHPESQSMEAAGIQQPADGRMAMPFGGAVFEGMDDFMWTDDWEDWGFPFEEVGPFHGD
jgi:hypothetical protein